MRNNVVFVTAVSFHPHRALRGASSTLDRDLEDKAYQLPDDYVGRNGF